MPFKSEKQRRYMHANLPEIAQRWERDYASGGIARLGFANGNLAFARQQMTMPQNYYKTPFEGARTIDTYKNVDPYRMNYLNDDLPNTYRSQSMLPGIQQNNMISNMQKMNPVALDIMTGKYKYGVGPDGKPYQQPRTIADQNRVLGQTFTEQQPTWYNRMFNKARQGITGLKNKFTGGWDQSQNFVKNILDNTMIGRVAAGFDATNPRAFNYNPALQGQLDFIKGQGMYGTNPTSGLNQITGGVLAGKNLQSMFGSNDLGAMYEKSIAQTEKTLAGLLEEDEEGNNIGSWSNLAKTKPAAFAKKVAIHKARLQKKQNEYNIFKANQEKIRQENIAKERAAGAAANQATQRRAGRGGDHMSRSRDQGGLGISQAQAQAVSDANRAAGMGGWGLAKGGLASLWPK